MNIPAAVEQAIKNYDKIGYGGELPEADLEAAHDFVLSLVHRSGVDLTTAVKLVHMIEGGHWSKGWEQGYSSAKNHYTPRFSLAPTEGYGSQEFRDEIEKSEA